MAGFMQIKSLNPKLGQDQTEKKYVIQLVLYNFIDRI